MGYFDSYLTEKRDNEYMISPRLNAKTKEAIKLFSRKQAQGRNAVCRKQFCSGQNTGYGTVIYKMGTEKRVVCHFVSENRGLKSDLQSR